MFPGFACKHSGSVGKTYFSDKLIYMIDENNISFFSIIAISLYIIFYIGKKLKLKSFYSCFLYAWHTIFCLIYYIYSKTNIADSTMYYEVSKSSYFKYTFNGTDNVILFTKIFSDYLGLSYLNTFLIFNLIGSLGLIILASSYQDIINRKIQLNKSKLVIFLLLTPSMSFWSSAIGKDSISFLAVTLLLKSLTNQKNNNILLSLTSVIIMFLVRPHMSAAMLLTLSIYLIFKKEIHIIQKSLLMITIVTTGILSANYIINYVGLEDGATKDDLFSYIEERQSLNQSGAGALDISQMTLPEQFFTYIFRPMPWDINNILSAAAAIENSFILFIFLIILYKIFFKNIRQPKNNKYYLLYVSICLLILAPTTANIGISLRQKWMFMPLLIAFLIGTYYTQNQKLTQKNESN